MKPNEHLDIEGMEVTPASLHKYEARAEVFAAYRAGLLLPYCSVTPVFQVAGKTVPKAFGDNCIGQAEEVALELQKFSSIEPLYVREGRHHAVIWTEDGQTFFFDPYLLHQEPINLDVIRLSPEQRQRFAAYPFVEDRHGEMRTGYLEIIFEFDPQMFCVKKGRFDPERDSYDVTTFSFDLGSRTPYRTAPGDSEIAFAQEQTTLSIRTLDKQTGGVMHLVYPISKTHPQGIVDSQLLYIKTNIGAVLQNGSSEYGMALKEIADFVGHSPDALESFVMDGVSLYEKHAPREIAYFSVNPTNQ